MKIRDSGHSTKNRDCPAKFGTVGQSVSSVLVLDNQNNIVAWVYGGAI